MQKQSNKNPTQKLILPQVQYHPSIQTPAAGGAPAKTRTRKTQKTRPGAQTGTKVAQKNHDAAQVDPVPAVKQKQKQEQKKKVDQSSATDPDPPPAAPPRPVLGVQLDKGDVEQVEVLTRGQRTNQDWFAWRKNRITASVAHRIAHCRFVHGKSKTPPVSYLTAITGEGRRVQTRAMSWGVEMEAEAVSRYQRLKSTALRRSVSVQECGLFIDAQHPWLAASPDGIVTDRRTGQWLLCLEVKCPYKHRHRRVEEACREDSNFCLEIQDEDRREPGAAPVYHLKKSHSYFTQIQCQLAVTGLQRADLAVFTLKETAIIPVTFDPDLWEETMSKLEVFYKDAVLPHIRKTMQQNAAEWTPEL